MNVDSRATPVILPTWADGARRARIGLGAGRDGVEVLVADTPQRRGTGFAHAPAGPPAPLWFSFEVEGFHSFWMRDVAFDLDLVQLDEDGVVLAIHRLSAGSDARIFPPEPMRYALELCAGGAAGLASGDRVDFDPRAVAPIPPVHEAEPAIEPGASHDPALVMRWSQRQHAYSSVPFAAAAGLMRWQLRVGPEDVAIWLHAGGGFVLHPPLCPLGPLRALTCSLGLAWLRLELAPDSRLLLPDGRVVVEHFDPRAPGDWIERMRGHGLIPTSGRWQQTRTLLVDLSGDEAELLARLPPRIRYEARAFAKALGAGRYRVDVVPGATLDARQERALGELHRRWLAAHPGAEDNLDFCRPVAHGYQHAAVAYLCWHETELLAVQLHLLWHGTLYYLFSEAVPGAPQGLTPGLLWHGVKRAKATPFGPSAAPDVLDLVGAFDPRYPDYRPFLQGFTPAKLRWHPTSVYLPPSVAFPGLELPP